MYYAGHAEHLGLYALPNTVVAFKDRLSGYKSSKGTIQFPYDRDLPIGLIEDIVRFKDAFPKCRQNFGRGIAGTSFFASSWTFAAASASSCFLFSATKASIWS